MYPNGHRVIHSLSYELTGFEIGMQVLRPTTIELQPGQSLAIMHNVFFRIRGDEDDILRKVDVVWGTTTKDLSVPALFPSTQHESLESIEICSIQFYFFGIELFMPIEKQPYRNDDVISSAELAAVDAAALHEQSTSPEMLERWRRRVLDTIFIKTKKEDVHFTGFLARMTIWQISRVFRTIRQSNDSSIQAWLTCPSSLFERDYALVRLCAEVIQASRDHTRKANEIIQMLLSVGVVVQDHVKTTLEQEFAKTFATGPKESDYIPDRSLVDPRCVLLQTSESSKFIKFINIANQYRHPGLIISNRGTVVYAGIHPIKSGETISVVSGIWSRDSKMEGFQQPLLSENVDGTELWFYSHAGDISSSICDNSSSLGPNCAMVIEIVDSFPVVVIKAVCDIDRNKGLICAELADETDSQSEEESAHSDK